MYVLGYSGFTRDSRFELGYRNFFAKTRQGFDSIFDFREGEVPFQMFPLGYFGHDAAATIIKDGKIVACAAEERFNRSKFSLNLGGNTLLPSRAIQYCLKTAGISIEKVKLVAHYCDFNPRVIQKRLDLLKPFLSEDESSMVADSYRTTYSAMMGREVLLEQFTKMIGRPPKNFIQVRHHEAHAASTFFPSGFKEAIILTLDGTGELESSLLAVGQDNQIKEVRRTYLPTSLGALYLIVTVFLGFKSLGDEYKVMGLAGYGEPQTYRKFFQSLIRLEEKGAYSLNNIAKSRFKYWLIDSLGRPRKHGEPITKRHRDIAAALQEALQGAVLHTLDHARKDLGIPKLCMAGGVALNSMLNGAIARSGLFDEIFIQPASSDEGCSLGAAYYAYMRRFPGKKTSHIPQLEDVYLGPSFQQVEISSALRKFEKDLLWEQLKNLSVVIAGELAAGKIVGWFQGRMEFGPRALGNRSILADPRIAEMKDRVNIKIKHREEFRPFAPAVLEEDAKEYFELDGVTKSPFMLFVVPVKQEKQASIPAVTHVDGTARIQTVSSRTNMRFWQLLREFKKLTGIPVILNTSFNVMNEPIVCTPYDAINCFLKTDIDLLAIGDYLVRKRK
jgi:carbamoyltransferase